jgi:hypothetical protein
MTKTEDNPMHLKTREPSRLRQAPRCLAQARRGRPCQSPAVAGKTRCRMHGGAAGSGAPKGKRNGKYRHGGFTTEAIDERRRLAALIHGCWPCCRASRTCGRGRSKLIRLAKKHECIGPGHSDLANHPRCRPTGYYSARGCCELQRLRYSGKNVEICGRA